MQQFSGLMVPPSEAATSPVPAWTLQFHGPDSSSSSVRGQRTKNSLSIQEDSTSPGFQVHFPCVRRMNKHIYT